MGFNSSGFDDDVKPLAEINIIPLVDVMLVLLIITMVTAPYMEQGFNIDLPKTGAASSIKKSSNAQPIIVSVDKLEKIKLSGLPGVFTKSDLTSKLVNYFETNKQAVKEIYIKADKDIPYGVVAEIMEKIQLSGITKVSLITTQD